MAKTKTADTGFTAEERAAIKERAQELRAPRGAKPTDAELEREMLAKIAEFPPEDRAIAERLHALVKENAPGLTAKLWYGMPGWARGGRNVCFFQPRAKFRTRYATLGFNDAARLDDGEMWPTAYAVNVLTEAEEQRIAALLRRAAG